MSENGAINIHLEVVIKPAEHVNTKGSMYGVRYFQAIKANAIVEAPPMYAPPAYRRM